MKGIILLLGLFFYTQAFSQNNVVKSCFVEFGCTYLVTNLQTGRETIHAPKTMVDRLSQEMKAQFNAGGLSAFNLHDCI